MLPASVLPVLAKAIEEQLDAAAHAAAHPSVEGTHDLRVSTRRLRAALELWLAASPDRRLSRGRKALRRLGRRLGALREADVNLGELAELRGKLPVCAAAIEFVMTTEANERRRSAKSLTKEMRDLDLGELSKEILSGVEKTLDAESTDLSLASVARNELARRLPGLRTLFERARLHPTPVGLHRLRIELKKFRYSVELCAPAYGGRRVPALIGRLKALQDALGIVHDANALHAQIGSLRADLRREGLVALERSLLAPLRAVAALSRERTAAAIRELEACRGTAFLSRFRAALRRARVTGEEV